ncbi:uncharacterized protein LOC109718514 isoform X1 [Ananas comosus]|uniref:Uncharacterized protein LOC109718514 isoform X1 n=1 Tax=Ananas comosus TaxID=4615 RepID=A0A6P5FVK3_ANACO|nr:uncharacterized protein LOC109718514 isoform X1 [Ananas comosus]
MGRSPLKDHYVNLPRRRSLRLMGINGISEGPSGEITSHSRIKVEVTDPEESTSSSILNDCVTVAANSRSDKNSCKKESNYDIDEQNPQDISLKDLRARCKAKKRKVLESSPSKEGDVCGILHLDESQKKDPTNDESQKKDPTNLKPKEEEVDLEEPLIILKLKRSKVSPSKRYTMRKSEQISSQCSISPNAKYSTSDLQYTKSAAADDKENIRVSRTIVLIKKDDSFLSSEHDLRRDPHSSPDLVYHVKSEASEICSSIDLDVDANSLSDISPLDSSSSELFQKVESVDSDCTESARFTNNLLDLCLHPAEPAYISPSSPDLVCTIENDSASMMYGNANSVVSTSNDSSAKHNCTLNLSSDLIEINNGNSASNEDITSSDSDYPTCSLNKSSADYVENSEYCCASEGAQELLGGALNIEHDLAIKGIALEGSMHKSTVNQLDPSFICLTGSNRENSGDDTCITITASENSKDDGLPLQELPIETETKDVTIDPVFLYNEARSLVDTFKFGAQDGRLESIVYDAINNYSEIETSETTSSHGADGAAEGTWRTSMPQLSECFNTVEDSPTFNVSSPKTDTALSSNVWQSMNNQTAKTTYYAGDMYEMDDDDDKGSTEALEVKSAQILPPCANMENTDVEELSHSEAEEKWQITVEQPASATIYLEAEDEVSHMKQDIRNNQILPEEHPPKKLLSNRMTISPTSQEKLCRAITGIYLCDGNEMPRSRKRLLLLSGSGEPQSSLQTDSTPKKPKNSRDCSLSPVPKGILKSRETSRTTASSCMKSTSPDVDIEKAIEFSQSQMRGIENVAVKLLKGLKSMKSIVEETVSSEAHSLLSKYTVDEIKATTENATELERTTRRWLNIMMKDCNRFCKILRSAGNNAASPVNGVHKGRRKITFADEAGGMLCHVKVFNQQASSLDGPETEKVGS